MRENAFPGLFLFGAPRCATSTLYAYLQPHPEIFFPALKEPRYFSHAGKAPTFSGPGDADRVNQEARWVEAEYRALYADAGSVAWSGDATTTYLADSNAARRIKEVVPSPKFIALLRNPVERAFSCYTYKRRQGLESAEDFEAALTLESQRIEEGWAPIWHYTQLGFYGRQVKAYLDLFPAECFRFYLYDDFVKSPGPVLADIRDFLGLAEEFHQGAPQHHNAAHVAPPVNLPAKILRRLRRLAHLASPSRAPQAVRASDLLPETRARLTELFAEDVNSLQDLIQQDLSPWCNPSSTAS